MERYQCVLLRASGNPLAVDSVKTMDEHEARDAFPSFRGGSAAKTADLYERAWTVRSLLDLLSGEVVELRLEEQGADGLGVEFSRVLKTGKREFHSVKRQAPKSAGRWTPAEITRVSGSGNRSILKDLFGRLEEPETDYAVFISQDGVEHLREAVERATASTSLEQFFDRLSADQRHAFNKWVAPLTSSPSDAFAKLRNCEFVTIDHRELVRAVEQRIAALIGQVNGGETHPEPVRTLLEGFAWSRLAQTIHADDVRRKLKEHGYRVHQLSSRERSLEQIRTRTEAYVGRIEQALINGAPIPRSQSSAIAEALRRGDESLMVSGGAGVGKSCILAQTVRRLDESGVVALAFPASDLRGAFSSREVGQLLGVRDSPAAELALVAQGRPAVLCIDQLDGLAGETEGNELAHRVLRELVTQVSQYPNLRLLFVCRSFDLEEETSIKWISEGASPVARRIEVSALAVEDVQEALESAEIKVEELTESQIELLRIPLHLFLFIEAAQSRELRFATIDDLFDAYWNEKSKRVANRPLVGTDGWTAATSRLSRVLSERGAFAAPDYELVDSHQAAAVAMASESVLFLQEGEVGFFHESFFDYAFARCLVAERRNLLEWLREDRQGCFRRRQVLGVLTFLRRRRSDRSGYLRTLEQLLAAGEVRFHIKGRVLDWLRSHTDPTAEEWEIVERRADALGEHAWRVPQNSPPWFDLLLKMQRWDQWLSGEDAEINRAVNLLQTPSLLAERMTAILELLSEHQVDSPEWRQRLWGVARRSDGYQSAEKREWLLGLIKAEPLERPEEFVQLGRLLSQILFAVRQEAAWFGPRVIAAWFDREIPELLAHAAANGDRLDLQLGLDDWITGECAKAAPREFVREMLPRIASVERVAPLKFVGAPHGSNHLDRGLHSLVAKSMGHVADADPEELKAVVDATTHKGECWTHWMCIAWLNAMSANPDSFADEIVRFILDDPNRRLDLGYNWGSRGADLFVAVSRNAVAAAAERCSEKALQALERAILSFEAQRECSDDRQAGIQLALLWCLPENRIHASTRQRINELEERFPDEERRGGPKIAIDDSFGWAISPISDEEALEKTDEQWLKTMRDVAQTGETYRGNRFVGGVHELAQTLEGATGRDAARFASLIDEMNSTDSPEYFEAVLRGLTKSENGSLRSGSVEQAICVLLRIKELGVAVPGTQVAHAIGSLADEPLPADLMDWLSDIARSNPDPEKDDWLGPDGSMAPVNQAINTARGAAALAIAKLLYADDSQWNLFRDAVHSLVVDPVLAVRSTAANCLLAILKSNPSEALSCFHRLTDEADPIVGSHYVEHFIKRATHRRYIDMRPYLNRFLTSSEASAQRVGARWIVLSALSPENSTARDDEAGVLQSDEHARAGAADIYAANLLDEDGESLCASRLSEMFNDDSEVVRESAARCWQFLGPNKIAGQGPLLRAFARSKAFGEFRVSALLTQLGESSIPLPVELCDVAERALQDYGEKAVSIQHMEALAAQILAKLVFRLLDETDDQDAEERVHDIIDRMIKANFYGVEEELRRRLDE